jgi:hypothetical protein
VVRESANSYVVTVPSDQLNRVFTRLREVGRIVKEVRPGTLRGQDQKADSRSNQMRGALEQSKGSDGVQRVGTEPPAGGKGGTIEKRQAKFISGQKSRARKTSVRITLTKEPPKQAEWLGKTWHGAVGSLGLVGRGVACGVIYAVVYTPLWGPAAGIAWWLRRRRG